MAKKKEEVVLEQTKSAIKLQGVVSRMDSDHAFKEGETGSEKPYKSLRFTVITKDAEGEKNEVPVELFGMEQDEVYAYNMKKKEGKRFPFESRDNLPDGYHLFGVRVGLQRDEEGKIITENLHPYDAVEEIFNELQDGMHIYLNGEIEISEYEKDGEKKEQKRFVMKSLGLLKKDIDFEAENFEETAVFEQEMVFVDMEVDRETKKAKVIGRTIGYGGKFANGSFIIDGNDKDLEGLIKAFKKLKFGAFMKVYGKVVNRVEFVEAEETDAKPVDKKNPFATVGKEKHKSLEKRTSREYTNELQIEGVEAESFVTAKYKEEDFVLPVEEEKAEEANDDNPFAETGDGEEDGDDLW